MYKFCYSFLALLSYPWIKTFIFAFSALGPKQRLTEIRHNVRDDAELVITI